MIDDGKNDVDLNKRVCWEVFFVGVATVLV